MIQNQDKEYITPEMIQGGQAFSDGIPLEQNPHPQRSCEADDWTLGWCNAEGYLEYQIGQMEQ